MYRKLLLLWQSIFSKAVTRSELKLHFTSYQKKTELLIIFFTQMLHKHGFSYFLYVYLQCKIKLPKNLKEFK